MKTSLEKAVEIVGGQSALADAIGVSQARVWNWLNRDAAMPAEYYIPIALATNWKVTPHQLNERVYPSQFDGLPPEVIENKVKTKNKKQGRSAA